MTTRSAGDDGRLADSTNRLPRKSSLVRRINRWLRRLATQSDDPDALVAFFRLFR